MTRPRVTYQAFHVWAINKQQMYEGVPTAQVVDFAGDNSDFTLLPANSRLQTGTPPTGGRNSSSRLRST